MSLEDTRRKIDLVDFGDICLFMFMDDNLYRIAVSPERKRQDLVAFQHELKKNGRRQSPVDLTNVMKISDSRYCIQILLHHLKQNGVEFVVLDIGSFVGDFGLKIANFAKTCGWDNRVIMFDPTPAGKLVPYNIEINQLSAWAKYEELAVGAIDGLMIFSVNPEHLDSAAFAATDSIVPRTNAARIRDFLHLTTVNKISSLRRYAEFRLAKLKPAREKDTTYNIIARCVNIVSYLDREGISDPLFVKIDIEGFDRVVIEDLCTLLPNREISFIFEFATGIFGDIDSAASYLSQLNDRFALFDLYYSPNPTRVSPVEPNQIQRFVEKVKYRPFSYTDILAVDRRTPNLDQLTARFASLIPEPDRREL